jgi:hypothetical protein
MSAQAGATPQTGEEGSARFTLNRVVAFAGPYVAIVSGAIAAWLGNHFPGLAIDRGTVTANVATAIEFALGTGVTWALHHKWLDGWQRWEAAALAVQGSAGGGAPGGSLGEAGGQAGDVRSEPVEGEVVDGPAAWDPGFEPAGDPLVPDPPPRPEPVIDDPFAPPVR